MSKNAMTYLRLMVRWVEGREKQDKAAKPRWRLYWKYEMQNRLAACQSFWKGMTPYEQEEFRQSLSKTAKLLNPFVPDTMAGAMQPMFKRKEP